MQSAAGKSAYPPAVGGRALAGVLLLWGHLLERVSSNALGSGG